MMGREGANFSQKPLLVFWETTKSCDLSCRHCRASAIKDPLPDEMNYEESSAFIKSITGFGKPYPRLIITGGDPLKKNRILDLLAEAKSAGISASVTPAVTDRLNDRMIDDLTEVGVRSYALSLDGATPETHDGLRGVPGTFKKTLEIMDNLLARGLSVQVNTAVMKNNVRELPRVLNLLSTRKIMTWAPFFLIQTGRGNELEDLSPEEYEDVNNWLYFASKYGVRVRTVESPIFRRIILQKQKGLRYRGGELYADLKNDTIRMMRIPNKKSMSYFVGSRDGSGVIFVSHDGFVSPSGFLPLNMENVRNRPIWEIYTNNPVLKSIRNASKYRGKCSVCEYNTVCGGSRARAFFHSGDLLDSDPSCIYEPKKLSAV